MNRYSKAAFFLCCFLIFLMGFFYFPKWKQRGTEATISWDVSGYYMYLPALFIYNDIKQCRFQNDIMKNYAPSPTFEMAFKHSSGNYVMKYSAGQALMMSPFFFIGHVIAKASLYPADGFSYPYQISIGIGMLLYAFLGLWILRKVLLNYFNDKAVGITLISIVFASNYLDYAAIDGAMTHNTLFTVYALLLHVTIHFYKRPTYLKAIGIGSLVGLATLTRPTEIISALLPAFWGIGSLEQLKERFHFFAERWKSILVASVCAALFISIQPIYWKLVTGDWLVYSYQNEGFSFHHPHVFLCTISYRSGWLIYSPVMVLALAGFLFLFLNQKRIFPAIFLFSGLFMYICFAWDTWWYGGSLGQRAMVQCYPVLAFPIAAIVSVIISKNFLSRLLLAIFLSFCTWYNLWLTHESHKGGLYRAGEMTKEYFWAIFGKLKVDERVESLLDNDALYDGEPPSASVVYQNNFDSDSSRNAIINDKGKSVYLDKDLQFSNEYFFTIPNDKKWIRASADFSIEQKEWIAWKGTQFVLRFYKNDKLIKTNQVRVYRLMNDGESKNIWLDAKIPIGKFDKVSVIFWNAGGDKKIIIDNLKVICF